MKLALRKIRQVIREEMEQLRPPLEKARDPRRVVHFRYHILDSWDRHEFERQLSKALSEELGVSPSQARKFIAQKNVIVSSWADVDGIKHTVQRIADLNDVTVRMWIKWMPKKS